MGGKDRKIIPGPFILGLQLPHDANSREDVSPLDECLDISQLAQGGGCAPDLIEDKLQRMILGLSSIWIGHRKEAIPVGPIDVYLSRS